MSEVFVSYDRKDRDYIDVLVSYLRGHGVNIWHDHHIDYGSEWEKEIKGRIDAAPCMIVVMSREAQASKWVQKEIERANGRRVPILPLLLEKDGVLESLRHLQFANVIGGQTPPLAFCQQIPGFLVSERDIMGALSERQRAVARRIARAIGALRPGSKEPSVAALQVELTRVGLDPGEIDGDYGSQTFKAVREFQQRRQPKAVIDGVLGPITVAVLVNSSLGDLSSTVDAEE